MHVGMYVRQITVLHYTEPRQFNANTGSEAQLGRSTPRQVCVTKGGQVNPAWYRSYQPLVNRRYGPLDVVCIVLVLYSAAVQYCTKYMRVGMYIL
jgi:hypothetical protein